MSEDSIKALLDRGLSIEFIDSFRKHLIKEALEQDRKCQELKEVALDKAHKMADLLKTKYDAEKVYLFGSLAWGFFDEYSDIDIYVVGFEGDYWRALIDMEEIALPFRFDLVCAEGAARSLRDKVFEGGILL